MKTIKSILAVATILTLSSCSLFKDYAYQDYAAKPISTPSSTLKDIKKQLLQEDYVSDKCVPIVTGTQCKSERNASTAGLIAVSDELCQEHVKTIFGNEAAYNLTLGSFTNLFAGAATVAGSKGAKTLFSSIALFTNAERSLVNETVYKTMLVTSVTRKIREGRVEKRNAILLRMRSDDIYQYTLNESLADVMAYHITCSFMYGLERALEEGTENGAARKRLVFERDLQKAVNEYDVRIKLFEIKDITKTTDPQALALKARIELLNKQLNTLDSVDAAGGKDATSDKAETPADTKSAEPAKEVNPAAAKK